MVCLIQSVASALSSPRTGPGAVFALAAAWLVAASVAHGQCGSSFSTAVKYGAGTGPYAVVIGDLNGDGRLDLAVANYNSANVSVLLGHGDGTFATAVNFPAGYYPTDVAISDLNADGRPDLAVANDTTQGHSHVSILIAEGGGVFAGPVTYSTGDGRGSLTIGDFNGDCKPDLAVANLNSSSVSVLLANGDGTFEPAINYGAGIWTYSIVAGDINGDGRLDLVTANAGSDDVSVLLGNGNGTFSSAVDYYANSTPVSVAMRDLNGDGRPDLVVANNSDSKVSVLLNNGNGSFALPLSYSAGDHPGSVAIGDLNGDGMPDLAVANEFSNTVMVLRGHGDGTFQAAVSYFVGANPFSVAFGDLDQDGRTDIATANNSVGSASVILNLSSMIGITRQPTSQTVASGQTASFSVIAPGASSYQWRHRGVPISNDGHYSGVLTNTLTVMNATSAEAGPYDVRIIGGCNSGQLSKPAMLCVMAAVCKGDFNNDNLFNMSDIPAIVSALLAGQTCP